MTTLTLLLPERRLLASVDALARGPLAAWWARGDRSGTDAGREAQLRRQFTLTGTRLPIAALTRQRDAGDAGTALWLRADPAYVRADLVTARLMACGTLDLTPAEVEACARALRPLLGDSGFLLETPNAARWYLRCPQGAQLPPFAPPQDALGADLGEHLPAGPEGRRWRALFNEVQVVLHNHPANAARVARGAPPLNALWFWGAGSLPDWVRCAARLVVADDPLCLALAQLAKVALRPFSAATELPQDALPAIVDLYASRDAALAAAWLERAAQVLAQGAQLQLDFAGGDTVAVRRSQRWRFWRRVGALPA